MSVFNTQNTEWKTGEGRLFMGQAPALHDAINTRYPGIQNLYLRQVSQRWMFDEFNHDQSRMDLTTCPKSVYDIMLMNLAYQWEADSVASRSIAPLLAPYVTNSELWAALLENTNMEVVHALTYSEIVRHCVPDPALVFKMVMENERVVQRSEAVVQVFNELAFMGARYTVDSLTFAEPDKEKHYVAVMLAIVALLALEGISFQASFPATFVVSEQGWCQSISKAVQKVMLDELFCHAALDTEVLTIELATEQGKKFLSQENLHISQILNEVVAQEVSWAHYLFSEGRALIGLNAQLLTEWVWYTAQPVFDLLGVPLTWERVTKSPLPWMENWINIDKVQNAQQEGDGNNYALNTIQNDLGDEELTF